MTRFEPIDRRSFLLGSVAAALLPIAPAPRLETFTQWLNASRKDREAALQPCLDRIRVVDASIQAWVQVLPQKPTGDGPLSGIPFGAKDIIETRGLATEYGSPIYKRRNGTEEGALISAIGPTGGGLG